MVTWHGRYMHGVQICIVTDIILVLKRKSMGCVITSRLLFVSEYLVGVRVREWKKDSETGRDGLILNPYNNVKFMQANNYIIGVTKFWCWYAYALLDALKEYSLHHIVTWWASYITFAAPTCPFISVSRNVVYIQFWSSLFCDISSF